MKKHHFVFLTFLLSQSFVFVQTGATAQQQQQQSQEQSQRAGPVAQQQQVQPRATGLELVEYGVEIAPEPRLIVMMAALDAAGFDPTPKGASPSPFRATVRRDQANLDSDLRARMQRFYETHKLKTPSATPGEQAARYVTLAYALGSAPAFEAPPRSEELPSDLLEVLDFAPLVREFYLKSKIEERMPEYIRLHREAGEKLRRSTAEMVRATLTYLHTRPQTSVIERVAANEASSKDSKKKSNAAKSKPSITTREKKRRFIVVPDLLAAPGAINFRVIADDYYAVVPPNINPAASDLRRAYLQYVIDPLVARFNRDIASRRSEIKTLLDERRKKNEDVSPDVFLAVSRSLVTAADVRMNEMARLEALARRVNARTEAERAAAAKETQAARQGIEDASTAQLAESFEQGAVLAFYFFEQLRGLESSGFDIANFFPTMMASFSPTREQKRPEEYREARARFLAAREKERANKDATPENPEEARRATLFDKLERVDELLREKNYEEAETMLRAMLEEFRGEPRILYALAEAASLSAREAFDENLIKERLNRALAHYQMYLQAASPETDKAFISRAHVARGRILAFLERNDEAAKEFDAAIRLGPVENGAFREAQAGKQRLTQQK